MLCSDAILFRELPVIQKIIDDETWLEGERRRCYVPPHDAVVQERVCSIVLEIGHELRVSIVRSMVASPKAEIASPPTAPAASAAA
jgi:hypothetical protein